MCTTWKNHARHLSQMIDSNEQVLAHLFMEQLMLLPLDIQDKIINDISRLPHCSQEQIADIINDHSMIEIK